jgi:hypothetical protein
MVEGVAQHARDVVVGQTVARLDRDLGSGTGRLLAAATASRPSASHLEA